MCVFVFCRCERANRTDLAEFIRKQYKGIVTDLVLTNIEFETV